MTQCSYALKVWWVIQQSLYQNLIILFAGVRNVINGKH